MVYDFGLLKPGPGRLIDADQVSDYRLDLDHPTQGTTTRADLAAAMVAELGRDDHLRRAVSPTTNRHRTSQ